MRNKALIQDANCYNILMKERNYLKEIIAAAISRFGDGIDTVAFSWLAYQLTGSTLFVATLFAVNGLPNLIFGMISGVLCKYISEKRIMYMCDIGRGICVALIALLFYTEKIQIWHLYIITFLNSSFESFRNPASTNIIPKILKKDNLENGLALRTSMSKVLELGGLAIAPLFITFMGVSGALLIDSITFFVCGAIIMLIKLSSKNEKLQYVGMKAYVLDLKEGFNYVKNNKTILNICIFTCIMNGLFIPINTFQVPYVTEVLNKGSEAISILNIGIVIGMVLGPIFAPRLKRKLSGRNIFITSGILIGIGFFVLGFLGYIPEKLVNIILFINMFSVGLGAIQINFIIQIEVFKRVESEYLSRVSSIISALALCIIPIVSSVIGIISKFLSIKILFVVFGILIIIIFFLQIFNKYVREFQ